MHSKSLTHPEEMQAISSELVLYCVKVQFHYPVHKRILLSPGNTGQRELDYSFSR